MAVSEDIVLKVGVETTGAKKGLDKMRNEVKNTAKSVNELGGEGGALSKLNNMNTKTIFSISNLAQTFQLASGPAHQMKFVLGQVFDQFTLMGPQGLLLGAAVAGLGIAFKNFSIGGKEAKEALVDISGAIRAVESDLKVKLGDGFANATSELKDFTKQLRFFGLTSREVRIQMAEDTLIARTEQLETLRGNLEVVKARADADKQRLEDLKKEREELKNRDMDARSQVEALSDLSRQILHVGKMSKQSADEQKILTASIDAQNKSVEAQDQAFKGLIKTHGRIKTLEENEAKRKEDERKRGKTGTGAGGMSQAEREFLADEALRDVAASIEAKARREELAEQKKHDRKMLQQQKKADREAKQQLKKKIAEQKQMHAAAMDFGIGMIQTGGEMLIKGEEHIGQKLGAIFLRRTGEMLISDGQARVLIGVGMNATAPGSGVAAMTAGAAEIAAGIGMGAASAAITQSISTSQSSAGIATGAPMADRAGIASGEAPRGGSAPTMGGTATDGGGPTVINISYGVGGPAPEQTAQAVADALALATRRGMRGRV